MLLLSPSNTAYQVRTGLGLLTAMVACGPVIAKEVLVKFQTIQPRLKFNFLFQKHGISNKLACIIRLWFLTLNKKIDVFQ